MKKRVVVRSQCQMLLNVASNSSVLSWRRNVVSVGTALSEDNREFHARTAAT